MKTLFTLVAIALAALSIPACMSQNRSDQLRADVCPRWLSPATCTSACSASLGPCYAHLDLVADADDIEPCLMACPTDPACASGTRYRCDCYFDCVEGVSAEGQAHYLDYVECANSGACR